MSKGTAIITGSAQGIGKVIAFRLSGDGFAVVISDLPAKQDLIDSTVREIEAAGGKAIGMAADVTIRSQVQDLVDKSTELLGPLRVMVANAGIPHACSIFELSEELVRKVLDVNVVGVFNTYVVAAKKMLDQGQGGKIIGAASVAAFKAFPSVSAYTASKWAVRGLTQTFALELGDLCTGANKITVNCYGPGFVRSDMLKVMENRLGDLKGGPASLAFGHMQNWADSVTALKRLAEPEDIANVVSFLSSSDSNFMTGQSLAVDGGTSFN